MKLTAVDIAALFTVGQIVFGGLFLPEKTIEARDVYAVKTGANVQQGTVALPLHNELQKSEERK